MSHNWKRYARHIRFVLKGADQENGHLRRGATAMLAAVSGEDASGWKASSLDASLTVWSEYVRELASAEKEARVIIRGLANASHGDVASLTNDAKRWMSEYPDEEGS